MDDEKDVVLLCFLHLNEEGLGLFPALETSPPGPLSNGEGERIPSAFPVKYRECVFRKVWQFDISVWQ